MPAAKVVEAPRLEGYDNSMQNNTAIMAIVVEAPRLEGYDNCLIPQRVAFLVWL